jgi:putative ABC transport system permease protein
MAVRVRRDTAPLEFLGRLREIGETVAPDLDIGQLATTAAADQERSVGLRLMALMTVAIMGSVLLLSAAGVYAMMSFIVASRRRKIGIRAALGAAPQRVLVATFGRASAQLIGGALGGLALVEALARVAIDGSLLFAGESPYVLPAVAVVLILFGLLGTLGPALRGLAVQPSEALRAD